MENQFLGLDLNGVWQLQEESATTIYPAQVPGTVQTDLLAAGIIGDPYYRDNAAKITWVAGRTWRYSREFEVPAELAARDDLSLRCDGIDTLGEVLVNGHAVGTCDNMYVQYVWSLAGAARLRAGTNRIEVIIRPPVPFVEQQQKVKPLRNWGSSFYQGIGQIRKAHYHFGWDWAPPILPCGIWKGVSIVATKVARIAEVAVRQGHRAAPDRVGLTLAVTTAGELPAGSRVRATLRPPGNGELLSCEVDVREGSGVMEMMVHDPALWWPHGLGDQPLYELTVELLTGAGVRLDVDERRIGLREVRLVEQPDAHGTSFHFEANGVPFFAKGGNWVPADCFPHRVTKETYRRLIEAAAEENCNMLRVWGGGVYESDDFMDACDELGVCVWHDFMFSCATYPTGDPKFHETVRTEAMQAILRLRHHASLVMWCGNNELEESGLVGDGADQMPVAEYDSVFVDILGGSVEKLQPGCPYIRSSCCSPGDRRDREEAWRHDTGDAHVWFQVNDLANATVDILEMVKAGDDRATLFDRVFGRIYPFHTGVSWAQQRKVVPRFCSELGRQSFPNIETMREFAEPQDMSPTSRIMEFHQQADNTPMLAQMARSFPLPMNMADLAVMSQIAQGEFFRRFVELWRQGSKCMGALFWTFNDCWPSVEWSQFDHALRRKASFYIFRRFYAPVLFSASDDGRTNAFDIYISNDSREAVAGTLQVRAFDATGKVLSETAVEVSASAGTSGVVHAIDLAVQAAVPPSLKVLVAMTFTTADGRTFRGHHVPYPPKSLALQPVECDIELVSCGNSRARVAITASHPALWCEVRLEGRDNGRDLSYSDNYFHVFPGEKVFVDIVDRECRLDPATVRKALGVRTIRDFGVG